MRELHDKGFFVWSVEQVEHSTKLQNIQSMLSQMSTDDAHAHEGYAIILGNEVKGVKQTVVDMSDGCLEIPQFGTKHSLNVSTTAGIVIWEFAKAFLTE